MPRLCISFEQAKQLDGLGIKGSPVMNFNSEGKLIYRGDEKEGEKVYPAFTTMSLIEAVQGNLDFGTSDPKIVCAALLDILFHNKSICEK